MNDKQRTLLEEAVFLLNRTRSLVDAVYEQSESAYETLSPEPSRDVLAADEECGVLTGILGDIESAANDILEMLGHPRLPSSPRFMGPRRFNSV